MNLYRSLPKDVLNDLDPVRKYELEMLAKIANRLECLSDIAARPERIEVRM